MLEWYMKRYQILCSFFSNVRILLSLRKHSDPAETLEKIQEILDETIKELDYEKDHEKETE